KSASQDLRAVAVWPAVNAALAATAAPSPRAEQMRGLVNAWLAKGASRLDLNLDGKVDDPGAAILDAAWPKLADGVLAPVLGPLTGDLAGLMGRDNGANAGGSSYGGGWYGYVEKDLAAALGRTSASPFRLRYCGGGDEKA